jgi:hypothetical protein
VTENKYTVRTTPNASFEIARYAQDFHHFYPGEITLCTSKANTISQGKQEREQHYIYMMGRKGSRANNNAINVPWDHYSFDLGDNADLQPRLRKKVETIETEEGFCIFYPKHRPTKGRNSSDDRSNNCNSKVETETEERDPNNTSFDTEVTSNSAQGSSDEITHSDAAIHRQNNRRSSRGKYSVLYPKHHWKKGRNNNGSDDSKEIDGILKFQGNNRSFR